MGAKFLVGILCLLKECLKDQLPRCKGAMWRALIGKNLKGNLGLLTWLKIMGLMLTWSKKDLRCTT